MALRHSFHTFTARRSRSLGFGASPAGELCQHTPPRASPANPCMGLTGHAARQQVLARYPAARRPVLPLWMPQQRAMSIIPHQPRATAQGGHRTQRPRIRR